MSVFKKHSTIIRAYWQRALTYRFTVFAYRVGETAEVLVLILMWRAIFSHQDVVSGFSLREMITYVLMGNLFNAIIRNFLIGIVARDIKDGRLSMFLLKPMPYLSFIITQEIGRISIATFMSVATQLTVILFFLDTIIWNSNPATLSVIVCMVALAFISEMLLSYLIGLISFWTDEVTGIESTYERLKKFFSGGYFPLSLLPIAFLNVSYLLPFAYSIYVPAQLYLGKIDLAKGLKGLCVQAAWILILLCVIRFVWGRGLRRYEGVGI